MHGWVGAARRLHGTAEALSIFSNELAEQPGAAQGLHGAEATHHAKQPGYASRPDGRAGAAPRLHGTGLPLSGNTLTGSLEPLRRCTGLRMLAT